MNPDLRPGRLSGRRYPLEQEFFGCDLTGYDDENTAIMDIQPEWDVYKDNDVEVRGSWADLPFYKSFITGGNDKILLTQRKTLVVQAEC